MMRTVLLAIFIMCSNPLFSGVENYLKKFSVKDPSVHRMKNVDFIYTINLDRRPEKFVSCTKQLYPYGIYPFRFSAVNGWELTLNDINDLGVKYEPGMPKDLWGTSYLPENKGSPSHEVMQVVGKNYFCHCMSRGAIGIVLSHLSILQHAYDSGFETIWVMEDDIQVLRDPRLISSSIERLDSLVGKDGWDMLFTDQDTKNQKGEYVPCLGYARRPNFTPEDRGRFAKRKQVGTDFKKIGARYGAYSVIVRRSGMQKILNFIKKYKIFLPYDMEFYLPSDMRLYAVVNDIVSTQPTALSDNGAANYETKTDKK